MNGAYVDQKSRKKGFFLFMCIVSMAISVSLMAPVQAVYAEKLLNQENSQSTAPESSASSESLEEGDHSGSSAFSDTPQEDGSTVSHTNGQKHDTDMQTKDPNAVSDATESSSEESAHAPEPSVPEAPETPSPWEAYGEGFRYKDEDGTYLRNTWLKDSDGWHWFNASGLTASGWVTVLNGRTFYFGAAEKHHAAQLGEVDVNGTHYFVDEQLGLQKDAWIHLANGSWAWASSDGSFAAGWIWGPKSAWWYFDPLDPSHPLLVGEITVNGEQYYIDESTGLQRNGWIELGGGQWAWADNGGVFISGWKKTSNGRWWYFDPEHKHHALFGEIAVDGKTYFIHYSHGMIESDWIDNNNGTWSWTRKDGSYASGWFVVSNGTTWYFNPDTQSHETLLGEVVLNGGRHYYFDETTGLARKQWVTLSHGEKIWATQEGTITGRIINGKFFAANGSQPTGKVDLGDLTVYVSADHTLLIGWQKINGKDYFYGDDGRPVSGWIRSGGFWYYLDSNGLMQTGWIKPGGAYWYHLAPNGKMDTGWIKDEGKDYYLDPDTGAMKTGYVSWGGKLYASGADGAMSEVPCYFPDMLRYAQSIYSSTNWLIQIDTHWNRLAVYYGSYGQWVPWYEWSCTTGAPGMWTPHGEFTVGIKGLFFGSGYRCWYYTQISGDYLIHSILYNSDGYTVRDGRLGYNGSHGCVRLATENAKWIYDNIPYGTKIYIW